MDDFEHQFISIPVEIRESTESRYGFRFHYPEKGEQQQKNTQEKKDVPRHLDYCVTRYRAQSKPWLVLMMLHGWTSNKMSMVDQTKQIIDDLFSHTPPEQHHIWQGIWFVQVNAPFVMDADETGQEEEEIDCFEEQRFWWRIDGSQVVQHLLDNEIGKVFHEKVDGIDISIAYLGAIMEHLARDATDASFAFMGFSQGGGMAFNAALKYLLDFPQSGLIVCSGLVSNLDECRKQIAFFERYSALARERLCDQSVRMKWKLFRSMPVFQCHGDHDPTVFTEIGDLFHDFLVRDAKMKNVDYSIFNGYHEITDQVRLALSRQLLEMFRFHFVAFVRRP